MDRLESNGHHKALGHPNRIRVLLYHRIIGDNENPQGDIWAIKASQFRRQMALLDRLQYTTITFTDYRLFLEDALNLPRKPIIVSFDDGYLDIYERAFPILSRFGMRSVIFVVTDPETKTNTWDTASGRAEAKLMNEQQILEMHAAGNEIGSHSATHPKLTLLPRQEAWEQVSRSRMVLEIMLNSPVRTFSYPYGVLNKEIKSLVADAGYSMACAAWSGPIRFETDLFEIRRTLILGKTGLLKFLFQLLPPYQFYSWLLWRFKMTVARSSLRKFLYEK
jgi:peptidoglycan/xylan/chitin deacetylase (PgdA/CDA1 family)